MDSGLGTNIIPCGTRRVVPPCADNNIAKPAGRATSKFPGGLKSTDPSSIFARSKTGKSEMKKRKKSRRNMNGPVHPSVAIAQSWTCREEQMEEERARQAVYTIEKKETGPCQSLTKTVNIIDLEAKPSASRSTRRPWEWSAKDCETLLVDALSCPPKRPPGEHIVVSPNIPENAHEPVDVSFDLDDSWESTNMESGWASRLNGGVARDTVKNGKRKPPSRPVCDEKNPLTLGGAKEKLRSEPLHSGWCSGRTDVSRVASCGAAPSMREAATQQKTTSHARGNGNRRGKTKSSTSPVTDAQTTDELTARELSTELNRNIPRRLRSSRGNPSVADTGVSKVKDAPVGGAVGTKLVSGKANSMDAHKVDAAGHGLDGHPWTSKGLDFCAGTTAEVWWDDAWYRCRLSSTSAGGRLGVLEFLPLNPRKKARGGREYSTQLDLDEWIRAGHLVRPGNHLQWE